MKRLFAFYFNLKRLLWVKSISRVRLFETPWGVAHQAPPSMEFSARVLEWVAISFCRGSSRAALQADALPSELPGNPTDRMEGISEYLTSHQREMIHSWRHIRLNQGKWFGAACPFHLISLVFTMSLLKRHLLQDFPGGPVAKTLHSRCRGPGFDPWSGSYIPQASTRSSPPSN